MPALHEDWGGNSWDIHPEVNQEGRKRKNGCLPLSGDKKKKKKGQGNGKRWCN